MALRIGDADHAKSAKDIEETQGATLNYPIIADVDRAVSVLYRMLPAATSGEATSRAPADNQTVRNVLMVGPDKKVKLILIHPTTTGRNFAEVLRVVDALQPTARRKVATRVNWRQGEDVIISGSLSDEGVSEVFGGWQAARPYIRIVPQPGRGDSRAVVAPELEPVGGAR